MLSGDVTKLSGWRLWDRSTHKSAPDKPGVYIFRAAKGMEPLGRIRGQSDIVYIGCTSRRGTLRQRLRGHARPRRDEKDVGYQIERVTASVGPLEIAWRTFEKHADAAFCEAEILHEYEKDHIEMPPLNHQMPQRDVQRIYRTLKSLQSDKLADLKYRVLEKRGGQT